MHLLQSCLAAGITFLAAAQGLRAQQLTIVPCDGSSMGEVYCYVNNDAHAWHWQTECGSPITLQFTSGTIESAYDHLTIYDGPDALSPLLFSNGQDDLTGWVFVSTGADLFMQLNSNATNCCATGGLLGGGQSEWVWSVSDGSITSAIHEEEVGNFTMYPNPASSKLHMRMANSTSGNAEIRIVDVTGRVVYANSITATGAELNTIDVSGLQSGNYSVLLTSPNGVTVKQLQIIR